MNRNLLTYLREGWSKNEMCIRDRNNGVGEKAQREENKRMEEKPPARVSSVSYTHLPADGTSPASVNADRLPLVANLLGRPLAVHKCALHEKAMKGMKNSSPPRHYTSSISVCVSFCLSLIHISYVVRLINWIFCSKHWLKRPGWKPEQYD